MSRIVRTQIELDDLWARAWESIEQGTTVFPGMTYEEGVSATLAWLVGDDSDPMDEDN